MTDPDKNREHSNRIRRRYQIREDPDDAEQSGEPGGTMFEPPPPKAELFHRDDSPEGGPDFQSRDLMDPLTYSKPPSGTKLTKESYEQYDYQLPSKDSGKDMPWRSWLYRPIVGAAIFATLLTLYFMTPHGSPWRWVIIIVAVIYGPYMIINRPRGDRFYNRDWEPEAEPTGCFPYGGCWRHWWW